MPATTKRRTPTFHRRGTTLPFSVAAEHRPSYRTAPTSPSDTGVGRTCWEAAPGRSPEGATTDAPFGLPVLAELPDLATLLGHLHDADVAMGQAVLGLVDVLADDQVATVTGVPVEDWLAIVTRHTRMDRRFLLRTARLLTRFPALRAGVRAGQVSWPQLRGLALVLRSAPTELDARLDGFLDQLRLHLEGADPDAIVRQTERAIVEWQAELERPEPESVRPFLHLQPRLDGSGGSYRGELDAVGLAILDDATAPRRDQLEHPGGAGGARADNLLTRLSHSCQPVPDHEDPPAGSDGITGSDGSDGSDGDPADGSAGDASGASDRALPPVRLLLRWDFDALLDRTRTPADLLTRLLGGSLRLSSAAARRLLDARGAELRSIVDDDGEVVGVGRATRVPPGWLRDATLATHDTCTGPLCTRPALECEIDHARPWWPTAPGEVGGSTDLVNLGPLCGKTNREKERAGWRADQRPDGRRTWTHPRSGLRITSVPATWRPPPPDAPQRGPTGPDLRPRGPTAPDTRPRGPTSADGPG